MLTKRAIEILKNDGMTFEDITELTKRIESIDDGKEKLLNEKDFWDLVKKDIVNFHKNSKECIK